MHSQLASNELYFFQLLLQNPDELIFRNLWLIPLDTLKINIYRILFSADQSLPTFGLHSEWKFSFQISVCNVFCSNKTTLYNLFFYINPLMNNCTDDRLIWICKFSIDDYRWVQAIVEFFQLLFRWDITIENFLHLLIILSFRLPTWIANFFDVCSNFCSSFYCFHSVFGCFSDSLMNVHFELAAIHVILWLNCMTFTNVLGSPASNSSDPLTLLALHCPVNRVKSEKVLDELKNFEEFLDFINISYPRLIRRISHRVNTLVADPASMDIFHNIAMKWS